MLLIAGRPAKMCVGRRNKGCAASADGAARGHYAGRPNLHACGGLDGLREALFGSQFGISAANGESGFPYSAWYWRSARQSGGTATTAAAARRSVTVASRRTAK